MKKYIFICDKCKKEKISTVNTKPAGWQHAKITSSYDQYDYFEIFLCADCLNKLGFEEKKKINVYSEDIRDRLYSIFEEIMNEVRQ